MARPPRLMSAGFLAIIFTSLFLLSEAVPTSKCIVGCHGIKRNPGYAEGSTYVYGFEGTSVTSVSEGQGSSAVKLSATVELSIKPDCVHQLKLKNVLLNGAPVNEKDVEQHGLQFNYHNGHVDTSICTEPNDSQSSLNIKRAIASLFQSAAMQESGTTSKREIDVFGNCETSFEFNKQTNDLTVRKHKNLANCFQRENMRHGLIHAIYDESSDIRSSPILDSHQNVEQTFKNGVLNSAKSIETYNYRPFTNGVAGAKTIIETNLQLKKVNQQQASPSPVSIPKSLVFDAPHPVVKSSVEAIIKGLKGVKDSKSNTGEIKSEAAEKFGELIKILRKSSKNDIMNVYQKIKSGANGFNKNSDKKILLDALYRTGTGEAAEVAVELIKTHQLDKYQQIGYLASLSLVDHVNLAGVSAVATLLNEKDLPRIGYLGIGNVIGKYCRDHNCENVNEVKQALGKISAKIGDGRAQNRQAENELLGALKAITNAKHLDDQTIEKLLKIIKNNKDVSNRIRVGAIEALSAKCSMKWKVPLLEVFGDRQEDSEIRIRAYLNLMACPCAKIANRIKEIIDNETVNQVGSFVTTHLNNLRASTDPSKFNAKKYFEAIRPKNKFPIDYRKFSFNNELSYKIDQLGIGSTMEQNVIYSEKSFVPRSVSLNLTTELFGRSFNFLEIDTRIENLDKLIEHYFGPKGFFKQTEVSDLIVNGKKSFSDVYKHVSERIKRSRGRRSVQTSLDKFVKNINNEENEVDDDVDIDLSVKMFGLELAFIDFSEKSNQNQNANKNSAIDQIFNIIEQMMGGAKNFDYTVSNHVHFIDAELIYPTGLGFPLTIGIEGNGVTHMKTNGKIDFQSIMKDPKNGVVKFGFEPSASITIAASLLIDTFGVDNGLKVVGNLHTSTGSDVSLKILDGNGFDINFGIPKKKQEIISLTSQVVFIDKNGQKTPTKFNKGKEYSDCFDQFSSILGLTVCGQFSYPYESIGSIEKRPFFPMGGPAKFAISIENNDVTSYHFRVFYDKSKNNYRSIELLFDTPNSRYNRKVGFRLEASNEPTKKYIKTQLESPFKNIDGQLLLENNEKKKALTASLKHDNDNYYGSIGIVANGNKYKPILEYRMPDHIAKLAGSSKSGEQQSAYKLDGDIEVSDQSQAAHKYEFNKVTLLAHGKALASIDGSVIAGPNVLTVDTRISQSNENLHIKFDGKLNEHGFNVNAAFVPSKNTDIAFQIIWQSNIVKNEKIEHNFVLTYGSDLKSKVKRISLIEGLTYKKNEEQQLSSLKWKSELTWPAQDLAIKFDTQYSPKNLDTEFNFHYGKFKFGTDFEFEIEQDNPSNWSVELEGYVVDNKLELKAKHKKISDSKRKFDGQLVVPGAKYEIETITIYHIEGHNANVGFETKLKLNGKQLDLSYGVEKTSQKVNSHAQVTFDNTKYLDFLLKGTKAPANTHGEFNLDVKKLLIVAGQFTYQSGKGTLTFNIDLPKFDRKIKTTGDITVTGSRHTGNLLVLLDTEKDANKRIKLSTDTDLTKTSVDTKNIIEILSHKMEINAKGKLVPKKENGYTFEGNFDLHLPNDRYIVGNGKGLVSRNDNNKATQTTGHYELLDHETKAAKPRKISYIYELSVDPPKYANGHTKHKIQFTNVNDQSLELNFDSNYVKPSNTDEPQKGNVEVTVSGSYLAKPFKFSMSNQHSATKTSSWKIDSSLGNDLTVKSGGSYYHHCHNGDTKPCTSSIVFELKLPNDKLRNLKYEGKNSLQLTNDKFSYSTIQALIYNDDKKINGELSIEKDGLQAGQKKESRGNLKLSILQYPPLTIDTSARYDPTQEEKKGDGTLVFTYGDKKINLNIDAAYTLDLSNIGMNVKAKTAGIDKLFQDGAFGFERKYDNNNGPWKCNVYLMSDKNKYEINSVFDINNPNSRRVNIILTCPNGKTEISSMVDVLSENEYRGQWKVNSPKGFANADGHIKFINIDDFVIDFNFDSDKLKERKIHAEIASKPGVKPRKSITLTVSSDGKNIITGATNYNKREEANKVIIEGSGDLTIGQNEKRSSKFIYSRKQLTKENDGETGVAISLNANFDPSAVVGELKISDKEVHIFNSFCEKSKDCANFKLQSIVHTDDNNRANVDHEITVEVNLKKFYVPVEFGLKTNNKYHPKELTFDHSANLYLHTAKDKSQYSSHIYGNPRESGIVLTVPSREFALIASVNLPRAKTSIAGPYKIDLSAYLDRKNHPNDKTSFIATGDIKVDKNSAGISGEARFVHPKQTKDMVIRGQVHTNENYYVDANVEFDLFAKKAQKINSILKLFKTPIDQGFNGTGSFELSSHGQQLKVHLKQNVVLSKDEVNFESSLSYNDKNQRAKTVGLFFNVSPYKKVHLKIQGPNKCILHTDTTLELTKNIQKIQTKYEIYENPALVTSAEIRDLNSFNYQSYDQSQPNDKLNVGGKVIIGQVVEVHGDVVKNGEKKNLFNVAIYLDESRLLKPNLAYNKDNVAYMIDYYREKMVKYANILKEASKEIGDEAVVEFQDLFDHLKKSQANLKPLIDYYQGELLRLRDEIQNDKTLHEIIDAYKHVFGGFTKAVTQVIKQFIEQLEQLHKQYVEIVEKISEAIKATWPKIKESLDKILKASVEIFDAITKLSATYVKALLNIINQHQKEIREILTLLSEIVRDVVKIVSKGIHQIEGDVKKLVSLVVQQIEALPISELIKKKWIELSNYQVPEEIIKPIEEVLIQMIKILPTEELRQFGQLIHNYIMKIIKHQKIEGGAEIKNIYSHGIDAVRSIISLLQEKEIDNDFYGLFGHNFYANFGYLKHLPGLPIVKLSVINLIKNGELPKINELYYTYRPTAYLSDIIPPFSKMAVVVDGGHLFTFDERHLTLPGTCDYLLAHDTQDGNFSIIASLNDGKLVSVTVTAPGESITLKSNGNILVDDKPGEYPASTKNLHAFLTQPGAVHVKSDYGIHLICSQKAPMICSVRVSGFYHGKLRGLFGNANNEPYDDFKLPSGHISEKESDFGNAYQLNGACPPAPSVDHVHHKRNPTCTNYFADSSSSMSPCFNYADPTLFRQACDHATAANTPRAACLISTAYYAACKSQRIDISIPTACANCKVGNDNVPIGNTFSVKIPNKQADIIFVIEQHSKNEKVYNELITPLMAEVKNELKTKGINDIHVGLIGYGEHMKWPQHYTTSGSTNINGPVNNIKFIEAKPLITFDEAKKADFNTRLQYAKERADIEFGTFKLTDAYEEAINYPFRAGAAKVVIGIIATPCEKSPLPLSLQQLRLFLGQKVYHDLGLTYHHIGFLHDISVSGKPQKNVVGYDSEEAYTFADSKKNPLTGSIDKSNLVLTNNDVCAGFAVSSGGAAFSSNHFLEAKPNQKKQFIQVTARRITEGIADSKLGEDCVCKQRMGLYGDATCKVVIRNEK